MTRCTSCDGILTKTETSCYVCGEPVPRQKKTAAPTGVCMVLVALGLSVFVGLAAQYGRRLFVSHSQNPSVQVQQSGYG